MYIILNDIELSIQIITGNGLMNNQNNKNKKKIINGWNKRAANYDKWYKEFGGAVGNYVDWEMLQKYLPENKDAKILDAAGGTGRITLPLARRGYSVTLCDISAGMLDVAREKLTKENLLDNVKIIECSNRSLPFDRNHFDFVLAWGGPTDA
ncbi:MAG: hypothetical protein DRP51_04615, partial [Candidatus Zixiibacteriota bacterium]